MPPTAVYRKVAVHTYTHTLNTLDCIVHPPPSTHGAAPRQITPVDATMVETLGFKNVNAHVKAPCDLETCVKAVVLVTHPLTLWSGSPSTSIDVDKMATDIRGHGFAVDARGTGRVDLDIVLDITLTAWRDHFTHYHARIADMSAREDLA